MQPNRLTVRNPQGARVYLAPDQENFRARLLAAIRQRPAPQPKPEPTLLDAAEWQRRSRALQSQKLVSAIRDTRNVAGALGVTERCVCYWRRGEHAPTPRHFVQLLALSALVHRV